MDLAKGLRRQLQTALKGEGNGNEIANFLAGDVEVLTANRTITRADHNKVFIVGAVDLVATLPAMDATLSGIHLTFFVRTPSATTGFSVSPAAADQIQAKGITAADDKDIINTAATDAIGDMVELWGDGDVGYVARFIGTWAREA